MNDEDQDPNTIVSIDGIGKTKHPEMEEIRQQVEFGSHPFQWFLNKYIFKTNREERY